MRRMFLDHLDDVCCDGTPVEETQNRLVDGEAVFNQEVPTSKTTKGFISRGDEPFFVTSTALRSFGISD
jgi:hypothetical protein